MGEEEIKEKTELEILKEEENVMPMVPAGAPINEMLMSGLA